MFKVDRKKSNKLINSIKYITFASMLMLTPITANADDTNNNTEIEAESNDTSTTSKIKYGLLAIPFIYILLIELNVYNETMHDEKDIFNQSKKVKKKDSE